MVYDEHGLTHLAADVKLPGYLDLFSAFLFENKLKALTSLLRKPSCPHPQIVRRLNEGRTALSESRDATDEGLRCKLEHSNGPVSDGYENAVACYVVHGHLSAEQ